jgi:hypothetical protein
MNGANPVGDMFSFVSRYGLKELLKPQCLRVDSRFVGSTDIPKDHLAEDEMLIGGTWLSRNSAPEVRPELVVAIANRHYKLAPSNCGFTACLSGNACLSYVEQGRLNTGSVFRCGTPVLQRAIALPDRAYVMVDELLPPTNHASWQQSERALPSYWSRNLEFAFDFPQPNHTNTAELRIIVMSSAFLNYRGAEHVNFNSVCRLRNWTRLVDVLEKVVSDSEAISYFDSEVSDLEEQLLEYSLLNRVRHLNRPVQK